MESRVSKISDAERSMLYLILLTVHGDDHERKSYHNTGYSTAAHLDFQRSSLPITSSPKPSTSVQCLADARWQPPIDLRIPYVLRHSETSESCCLTCPIL